jgi:hypothetical protein
MRSKEQQHPMVARSLHPEIKTIVYYFDAETAQYWLDILQTVQIGYGAVLLSFLGAIHWGLEFAGMGGYLVIPQSQTHPLTERAFDDTFWEFWLLR